MEANWGSLVPLSSSEGTRDDPLVVDDDEDEACMRIEREDTVVPPARTGTPFVVRAAMVTTLVEIDEVNPNDIVTDNSIDLMEDQFMMATGVVVHRGRRIPWPPLDLEDEVVESSVVGEGEEAEIVRDFAGEEEEQREWDLSGREILTQSEFLQVALIGNDLALEFGPFPPPYEE